MKKKIFKGSSIIRIQNSKKIYLCYNTITSTHPLLHLGLESSNLLVKEMDSAWRTPLLSGYGQTIGSFRKIIKRSSELYLYWYFPFKCLQGGAQCFVPTTNDNKLPNWFSMFFVKQRFSKGFCSLLDRTHPLSTSHEQHCRKLRIQYKFLSQLILVSNLFHIKKDFLVPKKIDDNKYLYSDTSTDKYWSVFLKLEQWCLRNTAYSLNTTSQNFVKWISQPFET